MNNQLLFQSFRRYQRPVFNVVLFWACRECSTILFRLFDFISIRWAWRQETGFVLMICSKPSYLGSLLSSSHFYFFFLAFDCSPFFITDSITQPRQSTSRWRQRDSPEFEPAELNAQCAVVARWSVAWGYLMRPASPPENRLVLEHAVYVGKHHQPEWQRIQRSRCCSTRTRCGFFTQRQPFRAWP
jgi:hypothetical protein